MTLEPLQCHHLFLALWLKTKWWLCPPPPLSTFYLFPGMNQDVRGRRIADVQEVQKESLVALDSISVEDFRQCFQQWERHWDCCIQS